jgi:poly(3-hydroxybutyrate) depolymerase
MARLSGPLRVLSWAALVLLLAPGEASMAAPALSASNVEPNTISVSGFSAGGFLAMQMAVTYSSVFKGVGILAGGPYDCARQALAVRCRYNATPEIGGSIANMQSWSGQQIDRVQNIASQRVFIYAASDDAIIGPNVARQVQRLYVDVGGFVAGTNVKYVELAGAAHTFPTNFDVAGNNPCDFWLPPYISNCRFDGAGAVLQWIYGKLHAPDTGKLGGTLVAFDQRPFIGAGLGMGDTGWIYLPARCAAAQACSLHVALHGCGQSYATLGPGFIKDSGYNRWADRNDMIVLYPQASASLLNPNGCWDWVGWYGSDFDQKSGVQMMAIMAMTRRLASGGQSRPTPATNGPSADRQPGR